MCKRKIPTTAKLIGLWSHQEMLDSGIPEDEIFDLIYEDITKSIKKAEEDEE